MPQSYFIWKNKDCRALGVRLSGPAPIVRPEERVQHVQIPGISGDLTQLEGENIFNSYIQTVTLHVKNGYRVREIYDWLRGSGYVTFSGEPDRRQQARIIGAITLSKVSRNLDTWVGECQFYCQPLKEKLIPDIQTITSSGATVRNNGDVTARPLWTVTASGSSVTLAAGGKSITVGNLTANQVIRIDSQVMEVISSDGTQILTADSTGDFPVLIPGNNTVTGSGFSSVTIDKRERFL